MINKKLWISFILIILIVSSMAGCNKSSKGNSKESDDNKLVFLTPGDNAANAIQSDNRIIAEINKKLGIDLEVQFVPEGGFEKINVAIASGDLPDVVTINYPSPTLKQWINEGILIPINDYLPEMPTVSEKLKKLEWTSVDGKYYGYPFIEEKANAAITYRADWLEEIGVEPPKTLDEFYEAMKLIASKDLDGNGKADTYGLTAQKDSRFNFIFFANGLPHGDYVLNDAGEVVPFFEHSAFKPGMEFLKKLWDEKLLDVEFLLNDSQQREQKFYQGKVAFMEAPLFRHVNRLETNLQKTNPNGKLGFMAPPTGTDGNKGMNPAPKGGLFTAVTKNAKNPEKAAKFIEFMLSDEGRDLLKLGIEGVHYTKEGDKIIYNEEEREKDGFSSNGWSHPLAWGSVVWPLTENYLPQTEPQADRAKESVEIATENMVPNLVNLTTDEEIENKSILDEIFNQYFIDMITGKKDIDSGIKELSEKWRNQGGNKVLEAVNKAYKEQK
ncbi:extracellular solute-binding protein [Lederbergia wuyishanensis]|uniref:ABC-type glycerol-3-phosphate transport system substrate-binding protein n=1 Tax=Lederbergia wuyishanensis TaxID=1347903 RepID=A0ABU0D7F7_9BACI|nr:extracellular solute-binding protein [Lederbergia wuyishanensis]MCJ8009016.1 extracellular solute-binding protein [Lederbergia wuyishanensis]MDQ0344348.1 ABC-type glycerol-3-phosphate transport system substrate-binding protein [Lederbergia wuyishanensis]